MEKGSLIPCIVYPIQTFHSKVYVCLCSGAARILRRSGRVNKLVAHNRNHELDVHGSVHHTTDLIEMTNKMQLCRTVYYSIIPWLLNMIRAILSLIIRSF